MADSSTNITFCDPLGNAESSGATVEIIASSDSCVPNACGSSVDIDLDSGTGGSATAQPSSNGGVEELQTFLNNFNSELAAEHQASSDSANTADASFAIFQPATESTSTVIYGDSQLSVASTSAQLEMVDYGPAIKMDSVGQNSTTGQQTLIIQQPTGSPHSRQEIFIPIECTENQSIPGSSTGIIVNGNQFTPGSTVILPLIPTVLPDGTIELRIGGQTINMASAITVQQESETGRIITQPKQQILVIVGGAAESGHIQESPRKLPINRLKKYSTRPSSESMANQLDDQHENNAASNMARSDFAPFMPLAMMDLEEDEQRDDPGRNQMEHGQNDSQGEELQMPKHNNRSVFRCEFCDYTNVKKYLLMRHMKSHSEDRPYVCEICEKRFKTSNSLQNHVNTHTGVRPHRCQLCSSSFTTSGEMVRHIRYKHTQEKPHKCLQCDYASVELSKMKRHVRSHTGEKPYQCRRCNYASPDMYKLKRHMRVHTGEKPYECDVCLQRFTQSNSLKAHKKSHTGSKPIFQCEYCPSTCGRKTDLKIHVLKQHSSVGGPFECKKCGQRLADRYAQKMHQRSHDGERCFACTKCGYSAYSQSHLASHMKLHTSERPFACSVPNCPATFNAKTKLKRHCELAHPDNNSIAVDALGDESSTKFDCSYCGKRFLREGFLRKHEKTHRLATPKEEAGIRIRIEIESDDESDRDRASTAVKGSWYKCTNCEETFRQLVQLERHCQLEHIAAESASYVLTPATPRKSSVDRPESMPTTSGQVEIPKSRVKKKPKRPTRNSRRRGPVRAAKLAVTRNQTSATTSGLSSNVQEDQHMRDLENCFGFGDADTTSGEQIDPNATPSNATNGSVRFETVRVLLNDTIDSSFTNDN